MNGTRIGPLCLALLALSTWPRPALTATPLAASTTAVTADAGETLTPAGSDTAMDGRLTGRVAGRASVVRVTPFAVDHRGTRSPEEREATSRISLRLDLDIPNAGNDLALDGRLAAETLHGTFEGGTTLPGDRLPGTTFADFLPTEAWLGASWKEAVGVRAGMMTSQWGLGLVANDGMVLFDGRREGWFALPMAGDRVMRALLWTTPLRSGKSALRGLFLSAAFDRVVKDDIADEELGERARQAILASRLFIAKDRWLGLYYVHRRQEHDDGKFLRVHVIDLAADFAFGKDGRGLRLQAEAVAIFGHTNLAPSPEFPEHKVRQVGANARFSYDLGRPGLRLELDAGYFSGDGNMDDDTLSAFKADPNFQQGLVLFRRVLAWQTGRAPLTAANPMVVGKPTENLDRLASGGSVFDAITIFPKVGYRLTETWEAYTGLLVAIAPEPLVDPFHTRTLGGGEARNFLANKALDGMLGTELAVGLRGRFDLDAIGSNVWLGIEAARMTPGGALAGMEADGPIDAARVIVALTPKER